jgi:hypothetical protein
MKRLTCIVLMLAVAGCTHITHRDKSQLEIRPPESAEFWKANSMVGDCNAKAKYYAVALAKAGYKPRLVVIDLHDRHEMHTIVVLPGNLALDPSLARSAVGYEKWGRFVMQI